MSTLEWEIGTQPLVKRTLVGFEVSSSCKLMTVPETAEALPASLVYIALDDLGTPWAVRSMLKWFNSAFPIDYSSAELAKSHIWEICG